MATLDEILDYAMKRMTPEQRLRLGGPRDLFNRDREDSLYGGGLGLGGGVDRLGGTRATRSAAVDNRTTVNVEAAPRAPAPVARPTDADEAAQVSQAGWAAANTALSPLLSDWRTTPAAALTAAIGGYGRGAYAAKQDIAAGAAEKAAAEAKRRQQEALDEAIQGLPPEQQARVRLLAGLGATDRAADVIAPPPVENKVVGGALVNPVTGEAVYQAPPEPITPYQQAQLDIERAKLEQGGAPSARYESSGGLIYDKFTGQIINQAVAPPSTQLGKLIAERDALAPDDPRRPAYEAAIAKESTRGDGITMTTDENGRPVVQIGGQGGELPKPPTGYRYTDGTGASLEPIPGGPAEAASADLAGRVALLPGAKEDVTAVKNMLIDPKTGAVNRSAVVASNPPIPFIGALPGTGREVDSRISAAADTMVRLRSGASATESEMARLKAMYTPYATDSEATVKSKIARLERDLQVAEEQFMRGKGGVTNAVKVPQAAPAMSGGALKPVAPAAPAAEDDEYQSLFGVP
jgi:hypothetical protein